LTYALGASVLILGVASFAVADRKSNANGASREGTKETGIFRNPIQSSETGPLVIRLGLWDF